MFLCFKYNVEVDDNEVFIDAKSWWGVSEISLLLLSWNT